jgi:hypothetical protein
MAQWIKIAGTGRRHYDLRLMQVLGKKLVALALAAMILLVSATCTSAGCLLQDHLQGKSHPGVCCRCHPDSRATPIGGKHCPLCEGAGAIAKNVERNSAQQSISAWVAALMPSIIATISTYQAPGFPDGAPIGFVPMGTPPTLFALHCSLLN